MKFLCSLSLFEFSGAHDYLQHDTGNILFIETLKQNILFLKYSSLEQCRIMDAQQTKSFLNDRSFA
jgi:hypothetical protein